MKKFLILYTFSLFILTGCVTTGFDDFYKPWHDEGFFPKEAYLKEGEEIKIFKVNNIDEEFREIASYWYWCIGYSGFNGPAISDEEVYTAIKKLCKKEKATRAIWSENYTDTRNGSYSVPYTNYHYYTNAYGATSSYATTSYANYSYSIQRYDYSAYLFIQIPKNKRAAYTPGIAVSELTRHDREIYKQNTGALINIIYKNTEAYYANLSHGDIITKINGKRIYSTEDYYDVMKKTNFGDIWTMTILRNGFEKEVKLTYTL
jgi:C-terminal processing protease CtpA/Prc